MKEILLILAATLLTVACAHAESWYASQEKLVFLALREANANDEQRVQILKIFNQRIYAIEKLHDELLRKRKTFNSLDPYTPDYQSQLERQAEEIGNLQIEEMIRTGEMNGAISSYLSLEQWHDWKKAMRDAMQPYPAMRPPPRGSLGGAGRR